MEINGYKAFAPDGTNVHGIVMPVGSYHEKGEISFGLKGHGIHFAKRLEDTIRYGKVEAGVGDVLIASVKGYGTIVEGYDDYNGYYDLYSASDIDILKYLSREEIIRYALALPSYRMERFVASFRLTKEEINLFYGYDAHVDWALDYYQKALPPELCHSNYQRYVEEYATKGEKKKIKGVMYERTNNG